MATTRKALASRGFAHIAIIEKGPVPRAIRTAHNAANKLTWFETAKYHHTENRAKRFTEAGAAELGFRKRTPKYEKRKRKTKGHNRPNVWSGTSERRSRQARITATNTSARLRYNIPALNFNNDAADFRRISQKEAEGLAKFHASHYERNLVTSTG